MIADYIVKGKVERTKIAMDIKYRKLTGTTSIDELCNIPQVRDAFFGSGRVDKCPKTEWNADYLDRLSCAVIAEMFNRDYLLYLDEVADFVSKNNAGKRSGCFSSIVFGVLAIVVGVVICKCVSGGM